VTSNQTSQLYDQAVQSLKTINNELFYDELKTNLEKHENKMQREYEKVQKLLEDWRTTIESVPTQLSLKAEVANRYMLDLQEENMEKLNEDVAALFTEKLQDFQQNLSNMGKFQKNLQIIYKMYKELYENQSDNYEAQLEKQDASLKEFQHKFMTLMDEEWQKQTVSLEGKIEAFTSEIKKLQETKSERLLASIQASEQTITAALEQFIHSFETGKKANEAKLQEQFQVISEVAATQAEQHGVATQQLIEQMGMQARETENKYSTLKKIVIALGVGQAAVLGSVWYLGL
jgi:Xaa-Pro aminopeptidase